MKNTDLYYMSKALELAEIAASNGEVPVGAVVVKNSDGAIVGHGYNRREADRCALSHAEMLAVSSACKAMGGWRLSGCTLYVTLEPCPMCSGAIINSRIDRVVFGAYDPKAGSAGSVTNLFEFEYNHHPAIQGGVMKEDCEKILKDFFRDLRREKNNSDMKLIEVLTDEQLKKVAALASEIWHECFKSIITCGQIDYMLDKFQSFEAMKKQTEQDGYKYYLMHKNGMHIGYMAFKHENDGRLFLSKIYIKKEYRGRGYAGQAFRFLSEHCKAAGLNAVWLTVNKHNYGAIAAYEKSGFKKIGEAVTDIGNGYVMDDYFYQLDV